MKVITTAMPSFRSALSDNDRFGVGEAESTVVKHSRNKPHQPPRNRTSQPQKEDSLTSSVKELAADLGGFNDWRGEDKKPRKKSSGSGRRGKTSRRVHDCSFRSSGTSSTACPSDFESPSPKPSPPGSTKQLDVESPKSAVDAPGEKRRGSMSERTSKVKNTTTQATMNKYKQLYEAILSDPANAFLFQENTSGEWVGLGDSVGSKGIGKPVKPPPHRPSGGRQATSNSSTTPASPKPSPTELECSRAMVTVDSQKTKSTSFHDEPAPRERPHRALSKSFNSSIGMSSDNKLSDPPLKLSGSFNSSFQSKVADALTVMTTTTMRPKKDDRVQKALDKAKATPVEKDGDPPEKKSAIEIEDLHLQDYSLDQSHPAKPKFGESMLTGVDDDKKKKRRRANSFSNTTPAADSERQLIRIIPSKGMKIEGGGAVNLGSGGSVAASISSITSELSELKPTKRSEQRRQENERSRSHQSGKSRPRSPSPTRKLRGSRSSRSSALLSDGDSSVSSSRSNRSSSSHRSSSSRRNRSRSSRRRGDDCNVSDDEDWEGHTKETAPPKKEKKGLFLRKISKIAGSVKKKIGLQGSHKFKLGEKARYRMSRIKDSLESFDPETKTAEGESILLRWCLLSNFLNISHFTILSAVEIVGIHVDAVLEMPYYTIVFDDGSRKQTNWANLIPISEFNKQHTELASVQEKPRSGSRFRSISRGWRRSSKRDLLEDEDEKSVSSNRSSRSNSSYRSASSHRSSSRSNGSRKPSSSSSRSKSRERSPSPTHKRRSDGEHRSSRRQSSRHASRPKSRSKRSPSPTSRGEPSRDRERRQPSRSKRDHRNETDSKDESTRRGDRRSRYGGERKPESSRSKRRAYTEEDAEC